WIWTAIGETTNRAARLQSLTRDFTAETVIDEPTWRALGNDAREFVAYKRQGLRGMLGRQDLFVKHLADAAEQSRAASATLPAEAMS
ncbi:MAG: hypothetical protein ABW321_23085, partial [Polyangiales bacterium]